MAGKIELLGTDELIKQLCEKFGTASRRIENAGLRKAAEPIVEEMKSRVNLSIRKDVHLQNDIKASGVRRKDGNAYILIGAGKKTSWRVHFIEFGTVKFPARPFLHPGFEAGKEQAKRIMAAEFRKGLEEG